MLHAGTRSRRSDPAAAGGAADGLVSLEQLRGEALDQVVQGVHHHSGPLHHDAEQLLAHVRRNVVALQGLRCHQGGIRRVQEAVSDDRKERVCFPDLRHVWCAARSLATGSEASSMMFQHLVVWRRVNSDSAQEPPLRVDGAIILYERIECNCACCAIR